MKQVLSSQKHFLVMYTPLYPTSIYCKFENFRMIFISRIFDFQIISELLNSRTSTRAIYKAYCNSLLARTLFSQSNKFANISEN